MTVQEVDEYLATAPEPHRSTLESLRATVAGLLPDADQGIAYGVPCFKVGGKGVAGFGFSKDHCTYFPMSGSVTAELASDLAGYAVAKGSVRFAKDAPLPDDLVRRLVEARLRELRRGAGTK